MRHLHSAVLISLCLFAAEISLVQALAVRGIGPSIKERADGAGWPVTSNLAQSTSGTLSMSTPMSSTLPQMKDWPALPTLGEIWNALSYSKLKEVLSGYWILFVITFMIWVMLVVLTAYVYRYGSESYFPEIGPLPKDPAATRRQLSKWHFTWYQCGLDPEVCFLSFCCPWIRWAHTMDLLHLIEYGPAFAIFFMLMTMNHMTGFVFIGAYVTMLLVYYRQKLRHVFGMQNYGTFAGILEDWLCLCFCLPCTIAQEAQHVKFAAEQGYPLPACISEFAGRRKADNSPSIEEYDDPEPGTSSSETFHDVHSKVSGLQSRDSPAIPGTEPHAMAFGSLFPHSRSRSSSRGVGWRSIGTSRGSRRRSRSTSRDRQLRTAATSTPKAKATSHDRGHAASSTPQAQRASWHREAQNPKPDRLLAPPPVRAGAHGEVRPGKLSFVEVQVSLHDDLRAYAFLFVEVGCVGRCGATCRALHAYMWSDRAFWQFYCGPTVNDRLAQPWACPAHALREAFRRWIFHIDGVWTKDFRDFVLQARQSPSGADLALMLSYARYIASGLMPHDSRLAVAEFTGIMCELLAEYNPERHEERNAAEALTAQVECMAEVFTGAQIKLILSTFDCSEGRAVSLQSDAESEDPVWMLQQQEDVVGPMDQHGTDEHEFVDPPWGDHEVMWFG